MENVQDFVNRLIKDKGFENKDGEVLAQIREDLSSRIEDRINAMIMINMPEDSLEEFEKILDSHNEDEIEKFVKSKIENIEEKVAAELIEFKNIYLG